ncbi:MAG: polysaccharide deacetylase family protein [Candidatus Micrarchaeota archaeon]
MFAFRIDVDCSHGLTKGAPKILEILNELEMKASFYPVTGGETGFFEAMQSKSKEKTSLKGVKLPKLEILRIALFPQNFFLKNSELLKKIKTQGHEVGCHGWKHREWTKDLEKLDLQNRFTRINEAFETVFSEKPKSFACPGFKINEKVLQALDDFGYACSGDLSGDYAFKPVVNGKEFNCVQVPVNCKFVDTTPLIEFFWKQGLSDPEIIKKTSEFILKKEDEEGYAVFYCHAFFEGTRKTSVLKKVLERVKEAGVKNTTVEAIALKCRKEKEIKLV